MFLWLSAMPWAMWSEVHWMVVPITAAVSYLLLGIGKSNLETCS
jgi:predicted membrane chloride channel (bestrophin family)